MRVRRKLICAAMRVALAAFLASALAGCGGNIRCIGICFGSEREVLGPVGIGGPVKLDYAQNPVVRQPVNIR